MNKDPLFKPLKNRLGPRTCDEKRDGECKKVRILGKAVYVYSHVFFEEVLYSVLDQRIEVGAKSTSHA
jgi:hypothetical protein